MERILLIEPEYRNKFPPLGLMKIAAYHRNKGDNVKFYKGEAPYTEIRTMDRLYITTLFTFYYDITLKCIHHYLKYFNRESIFIGGIAASLIPEDFKQDTGVNNIIQGRLLSSKMLGYRDEINIDMLPLDYDILDDVLYDYPARDNYFVYTTRGCPRGCKFCAVRILEPEFMTTNNVIEQVKRVDKVYGEKRNIIVMDNNILCSPKLPEIVDDIHSLGFTEEANFVLPNQFNRMMNKVERFNKNRTDISRQLSQTCDILEKFALRLKKYPKVYMDYVHIVKEVKQSSNVLGALRVHSKYLGEIFDKYRVKTKMSRYVDFNQGIDARLIDKKNIQLLTKLPVRPFRLACDGIKDIRSFVVATKLAFKNGVRHFSNYMLYNWEDKPEDLWLRLHKVILLYGRLGDNVDAFSFPMKYAPIDKKDRSYIGLHWNKKYLDAVNVIINVTKGIVAKEKDFFIEAFGANVKKYLEILNMPNEFIRHRHFFEKNGLLKYWRSLFRRLSEEEKQYLLDVLCVRGKSNAKFSGNHPPRVKRILVLYGLNKSQFDRGEKSYESVVGEIESIDGDLRYSSVKKNSRSKQDVITIETISLREETNQIGKPSR